MVQLFISNDAYSEVSRQGQAGENNWAHDNDNKLKEQGNRTGIYGKWLIREVETGE